ncbi:MAG: histidine phosphatase family protein [Actinomycetota bacterium]|nr:histidine phosphatase family protein [Actinomycetota bacterium]
MLLLLRHGQSELNEQGALVGRSDPPLTPLGQAQAVAAGRAIAAGCAGAGHDVRLLTSPLGRARVTAQLVADELRAAGVGVAVVIEHRLIELDYGDYDGLQPSQVPAEQWALWRADSNYRPPRGESLCALHARCEALWEELQAAARGQGLDSPDVIAVSHVSPIKAAVAWALGAGPEVAWRLQLPVASLTRIAFGRDQPALSSFGEIGHLAGVTA